MTGHYTGPVVCDAAARQTRYDDVHYLNLIDASQHYEFFYPVWLPAPSSFKLGNFALPLGNDRREPFDCETGALFNWFVAHAFAEYSTGLLTLSPSILGGGNS